MVRKAMDLLHIQYPVIQAGMAGGITTPKLVAEVSNAGGLGTIGAGYMSASALKNDIQEVKKLTKKPFAVNLFALNLESFSTDSTPMQQFLNTYRAELDLKEGKEAVKVNDHLQEKLQVILEEGIKIVSTAFGALSASWMEKLKTANTQVIGMATNLQEARQLVETGYDIIVAQGMEAGGHRGTFDIEKYPEGCNIGLYTLVQELLEHLTIPIIAAGGIYTRQQLAGLLTLGASGVQIGTRFLLAREAGTNAAYRNALLHAGTADTVITKAFSGRPARAIRNRFITDMENCGVKTEPFPIQNELTKDIRAAAKEYALSDLQSLWAGQGVGCLHKVESAKAIVYDMVGKRR
ncbi:nitronate monooxygenase [Virgibacillus halophilus]|uniref:Probable nitronate monooxygenase n=1 Tax=Tigheibacillus halophilus TaxID=361280 RepID=A0ABU5C537_9BACI|nr:nitronate monooxygenase [Virgibacillus halophilus]